MIIKYNSENNFLLWMQPKMTQKGFNNVGSSRNNIIRCFPNGMKQFKSNTQDY